MKRFVALMLVGLMLFSLAGCKEKNDWDKANQFPEVSDPQQVIINGEDMNLAGKLYTEDNKPENSKEIIIYGLDKENLKVIKNKSYALPEKINIQYLLDTISAYSSDKRMAFTGDIFDDVATVMFPSEETLLAWLSVAYPEKFSIYNKEDCSKPNITDVSFQAQSFGMTALEAVQRTITENLPVKTVIFKTQKGFINFGEKYPSNGILFDENNLPLRIASEYNYYGDESFEDLCIKYNVEESTPAAEKVRLVNVSMFNKINSEPTETIEADE